MSKAFEKTLAAIAELVDATELLQTDIIISESPKKEDLQKIVSLLEKSCTLAIDAVIVFGKYENLR